MIAKPTTRDQARTNAILAAEEAHSHEGTPSAKYWSNVAQAWAAIAETFPHIEVQSTEGTPYAGLSDEEKQHWGQVMWLSHDERETLIALREGTAVVTLRPGSSAALSHAEEFQRVLHTLIVARLAWSDSGKMVINAIDMQRYGKIGLVTKKVGNRYEVRLAEGADASEIE